MNSTMKLILIALIGLSIESFARDSQKLASLIQEVQNYADSGCLSANSMNKAVEIMREMNFPISNDLTQSQADENDQLRDALTGFKAGMMSQIMGNGSNCQIDVQKSISALKKLQH